MIRRAVWTVLTLSVVGFMSIAVVRADEWNKKTVLTFSQPVEVSGHVLPAGKYIFKLVDSLSDRHIVQILNADESKIIATVMTIADYRLTATDETVIRFNEVPRGSPEAIRAWFYPGNNFGQEFVYPKGRATQLAKADKVIVPAIVLDVTDVDALKTAPIVAVTPDAKETPVAVAIQTTPIPNVATAPSNSSSAIGSPAVTQTAENATPGRQLPKTASALPLIALFGLGSLGLALGVLIFSRHAPSSIA